MLPVFFPVVFFTFFLHILPFDSSQFLHCSSSSLSSSKKKKKIPPKKNNKILGKKSKKSPSGKKSSSLKPGQRLPQQRALHPLKQQRALQSPKQQGALQSSKKQGTLQVPRGKKVIPQHPPLGYLVWDATNGQVLTSKGYNQRFYPASLTKMLTLYLVFMALEKKHITLTTPFVASSLAAHQKPSRLGLRPGQTLGVEACILALHLRSANDVAIMIGENLGALYEVHRKNNPQETKTYFPQGEQILSSTFPLKNSFSFFPLSQSFVAQRKNLETFVRHMNSQSQQLSMTRSCFQRPSGWHDNGQYTCLMDMARLIYSLWRDFPQYRYFLTCGSATIPGYGPKKTTNRLHGNLKGLLFGKTGYTLPSGFNLASLFYDQRQKRYIVVVVLGGSSSAQRFQKTKDLARQYIS